MVKDRKNTVSLGEVMSDADKEILQEPPRAIKELVERITGVNKESSDNDLTKGGDERNNSLNNTSSLNVNNKSLEDKIVYFQRMGKNKQSSPVYLENSVKQKLDYLMKSPKYKAFDRVSLISGIVSDFLEKEKEQIKLGMELTLEKIKNDFNDMASI